LYGVKNQLRIFWVIEQYPGPNWRRADITEKLVNDLYFPSINKPHFKDLYEIAGYPETVKERGPTGNFYTYETSARYLIIQREAPRLEKFEDFKHFMRYNNWKRDVYSNGDASQQIMSRYDQRRLGDPYGVAKMFGGLDSKCLKLTEAFTKMNFHAIASPAHENGNPVWEFNESKWVGVAYDGLPKRWDFDWIQFSTDGKDICANYADKNSCLDNVYCGWCPTNKDISKCMPGEKNGPFFNATCEEGWVVKTPEQPYAKPLVIAVSVIVVLLVLPVYVYHFTHKRQN